MREEVPAMSFVKRSHPLHRLPAPAYAVILCAALICLPSVLSAQSPQAKDSQDTGPKKTTKSYAVQNGSDTYTRTETTERTKTADGEVETQQVTMPRWEGDPGVVAEKEIRTKKLPDGTVEKEYILKNPDSDGRLVPIEITRETIKKSGDSTTVEREVTKPDLDGNWNTWQRENQTETGSESARKITKEVLQPTATGEWGVVDREETSAKSSKTGQESRSVRQIPDANGQLADYEIREEHTSNQPGKSTGDVVVQRRDFSQSDPNQFILVEHTTSQRTTSQDGKVVTNSTTESDLLAGGAHRNLDPGPSRVVEQKTEEETVGKDGSRQVVTKVDERGVGDPGLRPSYQVIKETDAKGNVRQVFIPTF
jgi:hypothetical protein